MSSADDSLCQAKQSIRTHQHLKAHPVCGYAGTITFGERSFPAIANTSFWLLAVLAAVTIQICTTVLAPCHWPAVSLYLDSPGNSWAACQNSPGSAILCLISIEQHTIDIPEEHDVRLRIVYRIVDPPS